MSGFVYAGCELRRLSAHASFLIARVAFPALVVFAVLSVLPRSADLHEASRVAAGVFTIFFWCEMIVAAVLVPALVAPDMPLERERGMLELLLACPQRDRDLILGKFAAHVATIGALLAASFPVGVGAVVLGGAPPGRALVSCVGIMLSAVFATAVSVRVSLMESGTIRATLVALGLHGAIIAAVALADTVIGSVGPGASLYVSLFLLGGGAGAVLSLWRTGSARPEWIVGSAVLVLAAGSLLLPPPSSMFFSPPSHASVREVHQFCPWYLYAQDAAGDPSVTWVHRFVAWGVHLVLIAFAVGTLVDPATCARFATNSRGEDNEPIRLPPRPPRPDPNPGESIAGALLAARTASKRAELARHPQKRGGAEAEREVPLAVMFPPAAPPPPAPPPWLPVTRRAVLPVWPMPILWRESMFVLSGGMKALMALATLVAAGCLLYSFGGNADGGTFTHTGYRWYSSYTESSHALWDGQHAGLYVELVLLSILVAAAGASTFAPERQKQTLGVLLATGVTMKKILGQKFLSIAYWLWPLFAVVALHLVIVIIDLGACGKGIAFVFVMTVFAVGSVSVAASALATRLRMALPLAFLVPLVIWAVPALLAYSSPLLPRAFVDFVPVLLVQSLWDLARTWRDGATPEALLLFAAVTSVIGVGSLLVTAWSLDRRPRP